MTRYNLIQYFHDFSVTTVENLLLPVQKLSTAKDDPPPRNPAVYDMRLPDRRQFSKYAPYVINQLITSCEKWEDDFNSVTSRAVVRSVFCVYEEDGQEGSKALLNFMERFRIALWKQQVLGGQFHLDIREGINMLTYPDDNYPFYDGEILTTWICPSVEREVCL